MHLYLQVLDKLKADGKEVYITVIKPIVMDTARTIFLSFLQR